MGMYRNAQLSPDLNSQVNELDEKINQTNKHVVILGNNYEIDKSFTREEIDKINEEIDKEMELVKKESDLLDRKIECMNNEIDRLEKSYKHNMIKLMVLLIICLLSLATIFIYLYNTGNDTTLSDIPVAGVTVLLDKIYQ